MVSLIVLALIVAICTGICYSIAKARGAKVSYWVLMGALFGPFAIPFVFFAKPVVRNSST